MSAAAWFVDRVHPFAQDVGSIVPDIFPAYARVFHPAYRGSDEPVRWREIAKANGKRVHSEMQFGNIAGAWSSPSPQPDLWSVPPRSGNIPLSLALALVETLRPHTATPERCWFAMWEGWGDIAAPSGSEQLHLPGRGYFVLEGVLERALRPIAPVLGDRYQSPSLWWPDDHAWFVSTEVDHAWTYVGGPREAIAALVSHPAIEAQTATIHDRFVWDADTLNPSPGLPFRR
jgi:hypothetical protein